MATVRLFRAPWSTNCERVALALALKQVEVTSVEIDYSDRSPVIEVSGQPLVPVLVDGDSVIADSLAILGHLDDRFADPPLFPAAAAERAELTLALDWFDRVYKLAPNAIESALAEPRPDAAAIESLSDEMATHLDMFERLLDGRDYLFGSALSALDLAAFPFLKYARDRDPADDETFHVVLDEHQSLAGRPNLAAWIERLDALPRA